MEKLALLCRAPGVSADSLLMETGRSPEDARAFLGAGAVSPPEAGAGECAPLWQRWLRRLIPALAGTGGLFFLIRTIGCAFRAVQTGEWCADCGRFAAALFFNRPGAVLPGGLLVLLPLLLLAFDVLWSNRTSAFSN